jgi:hypothetical protein
MIDRRFRRVWRQKIKDDVNFTRRFGRQGESLAKVGNLIYSVKFSDRLPEP